MKRSKQELIELIRNQLARLNHLDYYLNLRCDLPQMSMKGLGDLLELLDEARVTKRRILGICKHRERIIQMLESLVRAEIDDPGTQASG